jgi:hypothetical protein
MRFTLIFIFIFIGKQITCFAQTLLVPDQSASFDQYKIHCQKEGYLCTMNEDLRKKQHSENLIFNEFVNRLDYGSEEFKKLFVQDLINILEKEVLSVEQLEICLQIIQQMKVFNFPTQDLKRLNLMEKELQSIYDLIIQNELHDLPAAYFILFEKPIAIEELKKIRITFLKIPVFKSEFNRTLSPTSMRFLQLTPNEPLLTGRCETVRPHPSIETLKWQAFHGDTCSFSENFNEISNSTGRFINKNKTLLTFGAVVLGAALFLNQYEVKWTF